MFSLTKKALEDFDNSHEFERMCADILQLQGKKDIVPIAPRGGSDGGRDITFSLSDGRKGLACVTLRKDIKKKFHEDFSQRQLGEYSLYILFCTAYITPDLKIDFEKYCKNSLEADFLPQDIEALRSLLDTPTYNSIRHYLKLPDEATVFNATKLFEGEVTNLNSETLKKIMSRGYSQITIRPTTYEQERIPKLTSIYDIVRLAAVQLPKWEWNLPQLAERSLTYRMNWGEHETEQYFPDSLIEFWRFYQSGQFIQFTAFTCDWQKEATSGWPSPIRTAEPGTIFLADELLAMLTQVFRLAKNLVIQKIYREKETLRVELKLHGLENRVLWALDRTKWWFHAMGGQEFKARFPEYLYAKEISAEEIINNPDEWAVRFASHLFQRFGYDPSVETLKSLQANFL